MELGRISLRKSERALLAGGVGVGKSTLEEALIVDFYWRYLNGLILIIDSKPRFKAQYERDGRSTRGRYKKWDHGSTVPGSVVVERPEHLKMAYDLGARIVIAQARGSATFPALVGCAEVFYDMARASRPQLLAVDETMDFFRINGAPIGGDSLIRAARSGRELGLAGLYCSQRTRGIPTQIMEYLEKLYMFRLDYDADLKRTWEMGAPKDLEMPTQKRVFDYWTKADYGTVYGPYMLSLRPNQRIPDGIIPVTIDRTSPPSPHPAGTAQPVSAWGARRVGR